ncbi:uncharacterized protein LOC126995683 [Eriocheir sinensis]|uniref:uncharacterized protein LOC126995683 n=1 Tax=Eriocheir sinensis TaxID=95602 RepID=UPI0021C608A4|nr:uncharacterized protein LOC126995683 [Eriocheir sinensis]
MADVLAGPSHDQGMERAGEGGEGRRGKPEVLLQEVTNSTALRVLDSFNRKIRAAEEKLIQQRVNAAILTVELATLHDPQMHELLALNTQGYSNLSNKIDKYKNLLDQFSQEIKSCFPQSAENPLQDLSILSPSDSPSHPLLG